MKKSSRLLPSLRSRHLATVPAAIILLLAQTFHGELLQAQEIANTDWSLTAIPASSQAPQQASAIIENPDGTVVMNHQVSTANSTVPLARQNEVMARAEREQFHFRVDDESPSTFRGINPVLHFNFAHSPAGLLVTPRPIPGTSHLTSTTPNDWSVRIQTTSLRFDEQALPLHQVPASPSTFENQSSLQIAPRCNEWFINRSAGLEHGYTIQDPDLPDPQILSIDLEFATNLSARFNPVMQSVDFHDTDNRTHLVYRDLHVFDQTGRELPSALTLGPPTPGPALINLSCDVRDAIFPLLVDPVVATQIGASRMASDGAAGDGFGTASAGDGDHSAISAPNKGNGVVYVYHRNEGGTDNWGEVTKLEVPASETPGTDDDFGSSLAITHDRITDTTYLCVGAEKHGGCGAVFVFYLLLGVWTFLEKFAPATLTLGALFACSLSAFGSRLAVGAKNQNGLGAVYVLTLSLVAITLFQTIFAPGGVAGDLFGFAVALYALFLVVGAPGKTSLDGNSNARAGVGYLFTAPTRRALFPLSPILFFSSHSSVDDAFATTVSATKDSVGFGAPGAALVLIFGLVAGAWGHRASLFGPAGTLFGIYIFMNYFGDIGVGAPLDTALGGVIAGAIYVYLFNPVSLTYGSGTKIFPTTFNDTGHDFGWSFFLIGILLFAMAPNYNLGQGAFFLLSLAATLLAYSDWILFFFTQAQIDNPALQHLFGPFGDFDGDGIPNFVEYLMGIFPTIFNSSPFHGKIVDGLFTVVYSVSLTIINAIFLIQYALALTATTNWFALGSGPLAAFFTLQIREAGISKNIMRLTIPPEHASNLFVQEYGEED